MNESTLDRIVKKITLRAPVGRVWRALTDPQEFGQWFRIALEGPFVPGQLTRGRITHPGYEHLIVEIKVDRMKPEKVFSYRWHPNAVDPNVDYTNEPMTRVEFTLEPAGTGTRLVMTESGFAALPGPRRAEAFRMNDDGWSEQMRNIDAHLRRAG